MTDNWEIVAGDFGAGYKAVVSGLDLSSCKARVKVWRGDTILIDEEPEAGMDVVYDSEADESYCVYTVVDGDFPLNAAVDGDRTTYKVMVVFTVAGYKEHDLGFEWIVIPAPPEAS